MLFFSSSLLFSILATSTTAAPAQAQDIVPLIGYSVGTANANGNRFGPTGVAVPARCPPPQAALDAEVHLRNPVITSALDLESRIHRFEITLSSLQALGCPASSTTLLGRLNSLTSLRNNRVAAVATLASLGLNDTPAALDSAVAPTVTSPGQTTPPPPPAQTTTVAAKTTTVATAPPPAATTTASSTPSSAAALVPLTGFAPGIANANGNRMGPTGVQVPARCPPPQAALDAEVIARNPVIVAGLDLESRIHRYEITLSSLQALSCPASSTTLLGRLKSLTSLRGNPDANAIIAGLKLNDTPAGPGTQ